MTLLQWSNLSGILLSDELLNNNDFKKVLIPTEYFSRNYNYDSSLN